MNSLQFLQIMAKNKICSNKSVTGMCVFQDPGMVIRELYVYPAR
jgi:hypothetical protein